MTATRSSLAVLALLALAGLSTGQEAAAPVVRVYLLAGQSNMEGQAVVDLDHPEYYNGGRGTLERVMAEAGQDSPYAHLRGPDGEWRVRDDVFVWYRARGEKLKAGPLSIGYAVYDGRHHFGPELQFGHVVGDHHDDPVLLVKTCWGGKSLFRDFRPPSAGGGEPGPYYRLMLADYRAALADIPERFPGLAGHRPELTGLVWFQGWNDMVDAQGCAEYADNLAHLIRDVRRDLAAPDLPVVVGETGNAASDEFRAAQAAGASLPEFAGNVAFVPTRAFLRAAEDSPNKTHGHHWFGNAASYFLIGDAFGDAMLDLLGGAAAEQPRVRQDFELAGRPAFVILPERSPAAAATPWVMYAPTLPPYPGQAEEWMFERFLDAGVAIAGIDVGESYGSPAGRSLYDLLYDHLVGERGFAPRPCLLARSRGGLMLYNWAADLPGRVAGIAGIYPVCNLASYPGLARAAPAYDLSESELEGRLAAHNPIDRLAPLAAAGVPIHHIHGDVDEVVPLDQNSALVKQRYAALGGSMTLETAPGQGHNMWPGFFQSQALVDFAIGAARTTRGLPGPFEDGSAPPGADLWISAAGSRLVPEKPDEPSRWTFADGVLTASPLWDSVVTPEVYSDFILHLEFNLNESDPEDLEARGNSGVYIQQRYEVQIHDSHGIAAEDYKASYAASLYRLRKPDALVSRPPGQWQSYDIAFRAARFRGDDKIADARITVFHNGVLVHDDVAIPRKTGAGRPEGPEPGPIVLQGHHNEVRFRNFWVRPLH